MEHFIRVTFMNFILSFASYTRKANVVICILQLSKKGVLFVLFIFKIGLKLSVCASLSEIFLL